MTGCFACVHVCEGARAYWFLPPSGPGPRRAGELLCRACYDREHLDVDELRVICIQCALLLSATRVVG